MWLLIIFSGLGWATEGSLLLVGNSYTSYNNLAGMTLTLLEQQPDGWDPISTSSLTQGGYRWSQHEVALADSTSQHHSVFYGSSWDWVVLQEQSQIPGFPDGQVDREQSVIAGVALNERIAAIPAETVLYMTWGRRSGDANNPTLYPDFETMNQQIDAGYLAYLEAMTSEERPVWVAPVGRVFAHIYDRCLDEGIEPLAPGADFYQLYSSDGSHPSATGTALIAATLYSTLTGRSASSLQGPTGLDASDWAQITADVDQVIWGNTHGDIPYPWALRWTDVDGWASGVTMGEAPMRPHLVVDSPTDTTPSLTLHDARLELREEGVLSTVTLGLDVLTSFEFSAGHMVDVSQIAGDLVQDGGLLAPGPNATFEGDYFLNQSATLVLSDGLPLTITGHAALNGTIELGEDVQPGALLIEAGTLDADSLQSADPENYTFVVDGSTLRRDGEAESPSNAPEPSGCACDQQESTALQAALAPLFLVLIRRQRSPWVSLSPPPASR